MNDLTRLERVLRGAGAGSEEVNRFILGQKVEKMSSLARNNWVAMLLTIMFLTIFFIQYVPAPSTYDRYVARADTLSAWNSQMKIGNETSSGT